MSRHGRWGFTALLAGAAVGALSIGMAGQAQAGAVAYGNLAVSNLQFFGDDGQQISAGDFQELRIGNFSQATGIFGAQNTSQRDPADVPLQCVGDCGGIGQNDFNRQPGISDFSRGDSLLTGAAITGVPGGGSANANAVAEVQLTETGVGTSVGTVGTNTEFVFALNNTQAVDIRFNADPLLEVLLQQPQTVSSASTAFSITLTEGGTTVFNWAPDGTPGGIFGEGAQELSDPNSLNTSITVLSEDQDFYDPGPGFYRALTPTLDAGTLYRLSINHTVNANAEVADVPPPPPPPPPPPIEVPEPATLGILGIGLLGLGALSRRRRDR